MNKKWLSGGAMTFLYKENERQDIQNYGPIALLNVIYKIWAMVITETLSIITNMVTTELQIAYESGKSTLDILSVLNKQIKNDETVRIVMHDLSNVFASVNRELLWAIMYKKGIPL